MDKPPVIVAPPGGITPAPRPPQGERAVGDPTPPVHALSALLLVAVDNLWNLADWAVIDWVVTIPLSFISVFVPVFLIQRVLKRDRLSRAAAFAFLLGVVAAIPTSLTGTPLGLALLAWTGLNRYVRRS